MSFTGLEVDLERIAEICQRDGVARLEVFGSVGRGDERPDSDIDVLYELAPGARLGWEIENLADELSAVLGRQVDLEILHTTATDLLPQFGEQLRKALEALEAEPEERGSVSD